MNVLARQPYVASQMDIATSELAAQLISEGDQEAEVRDTHWRCYLAYCQNNNKEPRAQFQEAIAGFAASLLLQHRCESTVKVYLKHVKAVIDECYTPFQCVMRALDKRIALRGTTHALDIDDSQALRILHQMHQRHPEAAIICGFMLITGIRCEDLNWIYRGHVALGNGILRVELRFAKNIRSALDRKELRVPTGWMPKLPKAVATALVSRFDNGPVNQLLFPGANATRVNAALKDACQRIGLAPQAGARAYPTTYSFRRAFCHNIEWHCTDDKGLTDWNEVIRFTLHTTARMVQAYYAPRVSDIKK